MVPLPSNPSQQLEKGLEIFDSSIIWLIIGAIGIITASILFAYIVNRTLIKRLAKQMKMDRGIEFAVQKVTQYVVVGIGVYTAFAFVGLPVSAFAGVFALLSVGIGFGLQNITANFISGIILLIERPIKVGDRLTVGEVWGDVSRINLRTTIIQTPDNMSIIVPNSKILDDQIINWTFGDHRIRIKIPVGVAYGSDIRLVEKALGEAAEKHNLILKKPSPQVWLNEFADSSLNFELLVWIEKATERDQIISDVNKIIYKLFIDYNIEIPFPQRDLNIKQNDLLNINQSPDTTISEQQEQNEKNKWQ
ncbi:mechanosensitive ion channel [Lentisphaera marina]|uniref:mechanosensitive ion channel family protein n=1 Tax=Lentisphaera marina TaxID=1111041 RepID=UPI002365A5C0|nr:mechanosensitive ion channel domain-containing protein [Lentisphaera marina]MDD7983430.1 mechanosensitive ion channel [Lentisphaera marina]